VIRVFLDANVLYSAAESPDGLNSSIFTVSHKRGDIELIADRYVWGEADIHLMQRRLEDARNELQRLGGTYLEIRPFPSLQLTQRFRPLVSDPADAPVLAGAVSARADWLVTNNRKDFEHLYETTVEGVLIMRAQSAFDRLTLG
jgi:predicted nucleic acid-binding protein